MVSRATDERPSVAQNSVSMHMHGIVGDFLNSINLHDFNVFVRFLFLFG